MSSAETTFDKEPADRTWSDLPVHGVFDLAFFKVIILANRHTHVKCCYGLLTQHATISTSKGSTKSMNLLVCLNMYCMCYSIIFTIIIINLLEVNNNSTVPIDH